MFLSPLFAYSLRLAPGSFPGEFSGWTGLILAYLYTHIANAGGLILSNFLQLARALHKPNMNSCAG